MPDFNVRHFDVLIIGAGISGIGAAHHLLTQCPQKSFAIVESKTTFGGTWDTHRFPGIRSDSDLYTYDYRFKPWVGPPIAEAAVILNYLREVIAEDGLEKRIHYGVKITTAAWSSREQRWHLEATDLATGTARNFSCNFLWTGCGYYDHSQGYTPDFPGLADYQGTIVHPQTWPKDFDYAGKRVVVIGSGATAATLIPNIAEQCEHVTMLQRSPTFFFIGENRNEMADSLRELDLPEEWVHEITRRRILHDTKQIHDESAVQPESTKKLLIDEIREYLGDDFDVETHFSPSYRPWQQRIAYIPDGDLFKAIAAGKVSVVTDHIDRFTEHGILTESGELLEADIIVTATGFNLSALGDITFRVDGETVDIPEVYLYRGFMYSGIPNMSNIMGYLRTSFTMRVDLLGDLVCRLLNHMDAIGATSCTPTLLEEELDMPRRHAILPEDFNSGYLLRGQHVNPKQGDRNPWLCINDYYKEREILPAIDFSDEQLKFCYGDTVTSSGVFGI